MNDVPQWLIDACQDARALWGVGDDWRVNIGLNDAPDGDEGNDGSCAADAVYLNSQLKFARDLKEGEEGQRVALHEVGHMAHAQIDLIVGYIISQLPESERVQAYIIYGDSLEQFLHRTTRSMIRAIRPVTGEVDD